MSGIESGPTVGAARRKPIGSSAAQRGFAVLQWQRAIGDDGCADRSVAADTAAATNGLEDRQDHIPDFPGGAMRRGLDRASVRATSSCFYTLLR